MEKNIIYLRKENNINEKRTPLIPIDIKKLIRNSYIVYVESSDNRIYKDSEYEKAGAIITKYLWNNDIFKNALIVGLKEIDLDKLDKHIHIYFSHSYKNQENSNQILKAFRNTNSILYDFEYFTNYLNKRIISFGYYAGFIGGALGILQYYFKKLYNVDIHNLEAWESKRDIINDIKYVKRFNIDQKICCERLNNFNEIFNGLYNSQIKIGIIGGYGNCGKGITELLDESYFQYTIIDKENIDNIDNIDLCEFDILYNCILLDENYDKVWFDKSMIFNKEIIIVDVSCDYSKVNNPIQIYNNPTTYENPVLKYGDYVDIISINNLPSLLPKDSSDYFSEKCVELLLDYDNDSNNYWSKNKNVFLDKIKN
jgi:saccharopine dehydrogenase (NAD+, L-lysine-forming)